MRHERVRIDGKGARQPDDIRQLQLMPGAKPGRGLGDVCRELHHVPGFQRRPVALCQCVFPSAQLERTGSAPKFTTATAVPVRMAPLLSTSAIDLRRGYSR